MHNPTGETHFLRDNRSYVRFFHHGEVGRAALTINRQTESGRPNFCG